MGIAAEQDRYRYFAYCVLRDAIGFYLGIPKFLDSMDRARVIQERLNKKIQLFEIKKGRPLTDREIQRCRKSVIRALDARICYLKEDYRHCEELLFNRDVYHDILDLDADYLKDLLDKLPEREKDILAIIPVWTTPDEGLGRPFLSDNREQLKF